MENKSLFIVVAVLAVAVLLVPMVISKRSHAPAPEPAAVPAIAPAPPAPATQPPPEPASAKPVLDAAVLDKLLYGMTYDQVVAVVGVEADETETQYEKDKTGYTGPTLTVWKTWMNPDGSNLRVGFVESKLEEKQFRRRERNDEADGKDEK